MAGNRYNFESPGAAAGAAIEDLLARRRAEALQQLIANAQIQNQTEQRRLQERGQDLNEKVRQDALAETARQHDIQRAGVIAENALPGDVPDAETQGVLNRAGYGYMMKQTPREVEGIPQVTPGILAGGAPVEGIPQVGITATPQTDTTLRGGSKYIAARVAANERADAAKADQAFRADEAEKNRISREQDAQANRDSRELIARDAQAGRAATQAVTNEMAQMRMDAMREKEANAKQAEADKKNTAMASRAEVNTLASEILQDPQLAHSVGAIQGRTPNLTESAVNFQTKVDRLKSLLSLENRQKLKGQGAISDKETEMLSKSALGLDPRMGEGAYRAEIQRIIDATGGSQTGSATRQTARNPKTGAVLYSDDGGKTWHP